VIKSSKASVETALSIDDERAIAAVVARYAWAIDERDYERLKSCFTEDADCHYSRVRGTPDELVGYLRKVMKLYDATMHLLGRTEIVAQDDGASANTNCVAYHAVAAKEGLPVTTHTVAVRYHDSLVKVGTDWRIRTRRVLAQLLISSSTEGIG
jgi:3-phenylpropionate/cinnamic acid dioxygenase small subunit